MAGVFLFPKNPASRASLVFVFPMFAAFQMSNVVLLAIAVALVYVAHTFTLWRPEKMKDWDFTNIE